jgi:hypothetical protein
MAWRDAPPESILKSNSSSPLPPPTLLVWLELLLLGAIWGGSFFFAKVAVAEIPPLLLVLLRVSIAAAALVAVFAIVMRAELAKALARWPEFLVLGLLNNIIPFSLIFIGQTEIGAGLAKTRHSRRHGLLRIRRNLCAPLPRC